LFYKKNFKNCEQVQVFTTYFYFDFKLDLSQDIKGFILLLSGALSTTDEFSDLKIQKILYSLNWCLSQI